MCWREEHPEYWSFIKIQCGLPEKELPQQIVFHALASPWPEKVLLAAASPSACWV